MSLASRVGRQVCVERRDQTAAEGSRDLLGMVGDLMPAEAQDLVTRGRQLRSTAAVVLEGRATAVSLPAIGLDDQAPMTPQEVDLVAENPDVYLGPWQTAAGTEAQEPALELVATSLDRLRIRKIYLVPEELGLAVRAA